LCRFTAPLLLELDDTRVLKRPNVGEIGGLDVAAGRLQAAAGATRRSRPMRPGPVAERQEHPGQDGVRMRCHRLHEGTVSHDDARGSHGKRERDVERVISGVADSQADVQGDVVQAHLRGRRRRELGLQEC